MQTIRQKKYEDFIFINFSVFAKHIVKTFKHELENKSILLFVDTIKDFSEFNNGSYFRQIYSFEYSDIEYARTKYGISVKYCPVGTTYHLFETKNTEFIYDISFVCLASSKRLQYLNAIAQYCYKNNRKMYLAGHFWHNNNILQYLVGKYRFKIKYPILYKYVSNKYITPKELAQVYRNSKILLNINISKHKGFNPRNFDIMVSNRLLVTDEEQLDCVDAIPDRDFVMANGIEDMVEKIDYYLKNEVDRWSISANGMKLTKGKYLFSNTLDILLSK